MTGRKFQHGFSEVARVADPEVSSFQNRPAYHYIRTADRLPTCAAARAEENPIARVKLFDPTGSWTWFISGYDPEDRIAWGVVVGFEREYGDIYMPELVAIRGGFGLPIERDLYWTPVPLSEAK